MNNFSEDRQKCLETNKRVVLETKKQHYRDARASLMPSVDVEFFKQLEKYLLSREDLPEDLKKIIDKKQSLRDVTEIDPDDFSDEIEIMDYVPPILK